MCYIIIIDDACPYIYCILSLAPSGISESLSVFCWYEERAGPPMIIMFAAEAVLREAMLKACSAVELFNRLVGAFSLVVFEKGTC